MDESKRILFQDLEQTILAYLQWMSDVGYSSQCQKDHKKILWQFLQFSREKGAGFQQVFTLEMIEEFKTLKSLGRVPSLRGFANYVSSRTQIQNPFARPVRKLPSVYEDYIGYQEKVRQMPPAQIRMVRRVLAPFHDHLSQAQVELSHLKIEHVDDFLTQFLKNYAPQTCRAYRWRLRAFLHYLFWERSVLKRDLSSLVVGKLLYDQSRPPQFLRPKELQTLFASLNLSTKSAIRTYAIVYLAFTLGLRPKEIASITLDDLCLSQAQLSLRERKGGQPLKVPLPEPTLKAIAAYLIGARPKSSSRHLFLTLKVPYRPIRPDTPGQCIRKAMRQVNLKRSSYGLRHTYAQKLLESNCSIFEIKEMLGHQWIQTTQAYLSIHTKLMREVILNETF
ncbi:MAG: tyrosine-type recombinase/integrase [Desulfoferrobacter sp.]